MSATRHIPNFLSTRCLDGELRAELLIDIADVRPRSWPVWRRTTAGDEDQHRGPVDPRAGAPCANFRGIQARVKYAEAFQSVRLLLNL
jgi:hypothetical protein